MNRRVFLDTNIVIDLIDSDRKNHQKAKELFTKLIEDGYEIFISEDSITTIYYILRSNKRVLKFFKTIIDRWSVVPFGIEVIRESIDFAVTNRSDLEDTLQCFCAKNNGCSLLITSDKKFVDCGVEIVDYDRFLWIDER